MTVFLETVMGEYNLMRSRAFAGGYEGVTHAGIAILAVDTASVLLAQRAADPTDDPEVAETWEFPGGGLDEGEEPFPGAVRELLEETYLPLPPGMVTGGWRSDDGVYQGFVFETDEAFPLDGWTPTTEVQAVGWFTREMIGQIENLRPEVRDQTDWDLIFGVSGNEGQMDSTEPTYTRDAFDLDGPIPIHGVVAPEETPSGDKRGFGAGAMTRRPLRIPFADQHVAIGGHDGSVVVGSVDRMMRKDGLIHFEGALMDSPDTENLVARMVFFDGRYGVSVDGDQGSIDSERTAAEEILWFDQVRAAGLTAVAIPAFHQAYVRFGNHPDMPDETLAASAYEAGNMVGARLTFDRGAGWVTDPKATKTIHDYWTKPGHEGYAKIGWGTPGDFTRAKKLIGAKIAEHSPDKMRFLNQIIAQWHFDALGYWPGDLGKPGNAPDTPENRRRAATHAALDTGLDTEVEVAVHAAPPEEVEQDHGEPWSAVLTSAATGRRAYPPKSYFTRHPNTTGPVTIDDPDEFGLRRTYGYAAEFGVCHIGKDGVCVEVPEDPTGGYLDFHKGRMKCASGEYVKTGLITYGIAHRDADQILAETATQAHFDDLSHAWAAVRVGEDERGVWFSGVVLPTVEEKWLTAIEASGQVSGEWLYGAMRTLLTVNVAGLPVEDSSAVYNDNGEVVALAASAFGTWKCGESPVERMEALRLIDAEERLARLRMQYLAECVTGRSA